MVKLPGFKKSEKQKAREKKKEAIPATRKWPFALLLGLGLGILALIDRGTVAVDAGTLSPCQVKVVNVATLPVRPAPDPQAEAIGELREGEIRGATTTVRNEYRELASGGWALDRFLEPQTGGRCAA